MIQNSAVGATSISLSAPASQGSTVTGTGVDIRDYEGYLIVTQQVGVVTAGSITGKLQDSDDNSTGWADVTGATFTAVTTSNDPLTESITIHVNAVKRYVRYVGTIVTGPALVGVSAVGATKNIG